MLEIIKFIFSDFWIWLGFIVILSTITHLIFICWNRFLRHLNIRNKGWPPSHLDADGDFFKNEGLTDEEKFV